MCGILGWFKMTAETSLEDMEWMLAKSAGYTADDPLVADTDKTMEKDTKLAKLRPSNTLSEKQKEAIRDNIREFLLKKIDS